MRCRIRSPNGVTTLDLPDSATVNDFKSLIAEKSGFSSFDIKSGFPPSSLDLDQFAGGIRLADTGLKLNGEQLVISARDNAAPSRQPVAVPATSSSRPPQPPKLPARAQAQADTAAPARSARKKKPKDLAQDPPEIYIPSQDMTMVLRVMPDDNSCLFRAIAAAVQNDVGPDVVYQLRFQVANFISANPNDYTAAILGKEPSAYCAWIQQENSWGGYIECAILSQVLGVEICAVTVEGGQLQRYNDGNGLDRIIIVYSGIHYDTIALSPMPSMGPDADVKLFSPYDDILLSHAQELCKRLNEMGYSTNTATFEIKCNVCGWTGTGEREVAVHAERTGHYDFGET